MPSTSDVDLTKLRIDRGGEERERDSRKPKRRGSSAGWIKLLIFLGILAGAAWFLWPRLDPLIRKWRAVEVQTGRIVRKSAAEQFTATTASGYVVPRTKAALAAEVAGRLIELNVDAGSEVSAKDVIARIDAGTFEDVVTQMTAMLAQQDAEIEVANSRVEIAKRSVTRMQKAVLEARASLPEIDSEIVEAERVQALEERLATSGSGLDDNAQRAKNDVIRLKATARRRLAAVETLEAEIASKEAEVLGEEAKVKVAHAARAQAAAQLEAAKKDLGDTFIKAPFAGTILRKEAELGEMVVPALAGGSTSRGSVVTLADFRTLEMEVDVFERDIASVKPSGDAEIVVNAYPTVRFPARVRQIMPTAERSKGTIQVKVEFLWRDGRPDARVLPEMGGKVVFFTKKPEVETPPEIQVPERAVTARRGERGAFVLEGSRVRFRALRLGDQREENRLVVLSGAEGGEEVILDPTAALDDGLDVKVQKADNDG